MKTTFPKRLAKPVPVGILIDAIGDFVEVVNDQGAEIQSVADPRAAENGSFVFCNLKNEAAIQSVVEDTRATVVVTSAKVVARADQCLIAVSDPLSWYIRALNILFNDASEASIHRTASIDPDAEVGSSVDIGIGTIVDKDCKIGDNCRIGPRCYIGPGTILGDGCFVQNNVTLGSVGLGYHVTSDHGRLFFPHLGSVIIGNDAVVGSGSVIVRGELVDTVIGDRTRIGNLVNVGHNVRIGADCVLSSGTCVAGGARIGDRCNIAVGVAINAKVQIGSDCQIGLGSVVTKNVPGGYHYSEIQPLP
jgi:UDP-3-O-[3-hydroxymyristoyl] glucosamine N-acyltransferase